MLAQLVKSVMILVQAVVILHVLDQNLATHVLLEMNQIQVFVQKFVEKETKRVQSNVTTGIQHLATVVQLLVQ